MRVDFTLNQLEVISSALTRLKFEDAAPGPYFGSPHLAAAHDRIVGAIVEESESAGELGRAARWAAWRKWQGRDYERGLIRDHASGLGVWADWTPQQKVEYLRICCSPFLPSEAELDELRAEVDALQGQAGQ